MRRPLWSLLQSVSYNTEVEEVKSTRLTDFCFELALLEQWKNEITKFSDGKMSVYIYHNTGKKIGKDVSCLPMRDPRLRLELTYSDV